MPNEFNIRPANPNDFDAILILFQSWAPDDWDFTPAKKYYADYFDNRRPGDVVLVGTIEGRVVGVTGYCPDEDANNVYWLNWFYVHKDQNGHGYGGALLTHVMRILKNKKARKLFVNTASYRFYKRAVTRYKAMGFVEEGRLKDFYGKGEHQVFLGVDLRKIKKI